MANIKSQIKRNRTNEAARLRNKGVKSALKERKEELEIKVKGVEKQEKQLQGLYERYGISPQQADGPDTVEELS